jgi:hypothetical protein
MNQILYLLLVNSSLDRYAVVLENTHQTLLYTGFVDLVRVIHDEFNPSRNINAILLTIDYNFFEQFVSVFEDATQLVTQRSVLGVLTEYEPFV